MDHHPLVVPDTFVDHRIALSRLDYTLLWSACLPLVLEQVQLKLRNPKKSSKCPSIAVKMNLTKKTQTAKRDISSEEKRYQNFEKKQAKIAKTS